MISITDKIYVGTAAPEGGGGGGSAVIEELNVTPTTSAQVITAPSGTDGYNPVNVSAVTSSIDANITSANIVDGITILGVTGSATELNGTTLNVTPTTSAQTITPTSPNNGFTEVDVDAVTSSIDANIQAGNIKNGVTILGVTGNVDALVGQTKSVSQNGVVTPDAGYNGLTSVSVNVPSKLVKANYWIDTSGIVHNFKYYNGNEISANATVLSDSLYTIESTIQKIDFSGLITISGSSILDSAFTGCTNLTNVDFSELSTVSGYAVCSNMFYGCTNLTNVNFPKLNTISGDYAFQQTFYGCTNLTNVNFPKLSTVLDSNTFYGLFWNCTSIADVYFNSLTSTSFGTLYTDQFTKMLRSTGSTVTHTLHFPSNLQSTISDLSGYPSFGGSSNYVVLAFDLPATS